MIHYVVLHSMVNSTYRMDKIHQVVSQWFKVLNINPYSPKLHKDGQYCIYPSWSGPNKHPRREADIRCSLQLLDNENIYTEGILLLKKEKLNGIANCSSAWNLGNQIAQGWHKVPIKALSIKFWYSYTTTETYNLLTYIILTDI